MQPMTRVQGNVVNRIERRFLTWICKRIPDAITSDHLTLFGVMGAVMTAVSYAASRSDHRFLWLAAIGYAIHWFGDSLDGSLARHRNAARPRYGYFLDHSVDAICIILMIGGIGLTGYVRLDAALMVVLGYFALSIHVFLRNHVTNTFQLSFMAFGPTEFRMIFVGITLWMYGSGLDGASSGIADLTRYDVALLIVGGVLLTLFAVNTLVMILHLRAIEGDGRPSRQQAEPARTSGGRARGTEAGGEALRPASGPRSF